MPATISVLDGSGASQTVNTLPALGQVAKVASLPVAIASDDDIQAKLGIVTETAPASDTASSGLNGRLQRIAQRLTSLIGVLPPTLGMQTSANSFPVTLSSDGPFVVSTGTTADAAYSGSGSGTIISLLKWIGAGITGLFTGYAQLPAPSTYRLLSAAASVNAANIKNAAGAVKGIQGYNAKTSPVFLKFFNKTTAPTVGTDTPTKTLYLPASSAFALDFGTGLAFATGIGIALTGAAADNDTTVLSAGDVVCLNVDYH